MTSSGPVEKRSEVEAPPGLYVLSFGFDGKEIRVASTLRLDDRDVRHTLLAGMRAAASKGFTVFVPAESVGAGLLDPDADFPYVVY